jgi:anti-sigma regulatory factor (Ser/Thr protein kinase)
MATRALLPDPPQPPALASALRWRQAFPGCALELARVRQWLSCLVPECPARDDVLSVAVELASNALEHTASGEPGGSFAIELIWDRSLVHIAVADGGSMGEPRVIEDPNGERGRGLLLVQGLSARTGWAGDHQGRVVWAQIAWPVDAHVVTGKSRDLGEMPVCAGEAALFMGFAHAAHPAARCCCHVFTPACPVDCLAVVLSTATFHALVRAERAPFAPPSTVGQVLELRRAGQLGQAAGLGRRRLGEIDAALVLSGLALGDAVRSGRRLPVAAARQDAGKAGEADRC